MYKITNLSEAKKYLDYLSKKAVSEFDTEEYLPLQEFFFKGNFDGVERDIHAFIFNDYLDGKISFDQLLKEIKKYGGKF